MADNSNSNSNSSSLDALPSPLKLGKRQTSERTKLRHENAALREAIARESNECAFCHERMANALNEPCGHVFHCWDCAQKWRKKRGSKCPICSKPSTISKPTSAIKLTCIVCYDDVTSSQIFTVEECGHMVCIACMVQHIQMALKHAQRDIGSDGIRCPQFECNMFMTLSDIKNMQKVSKVLTDLDFGEQEFERVSQFIEEAKIPRKHRGFCRNIDCLRALDIRPSFLSNKFICPYCDHHMCRDCKETYHPNKTCEQAAMTRSDNSGTQSFIEATTKACPHCGYRISHFHGHACHHIAPNGGCPGCHKHFCYVCLGKSRNERGLVNGAPCDQHWSTFCQSNNILEHIKLEPYPHDVRCGCALCPDCKPGPGNNCAHCSGNCVVCTGAVSLDSISQSQMKFSNEGERAASASVSASEPSASPTAAAAVAAERGASIRDTIFNKIRSATRGYIDFARLTRLNADFWARANLLYIAKPTLSYVSICVFLYLAAYIVLRVTINYELTLEVGILCLFAFFLLGKDEVAWIQRASPFESAWRFSVLRLRPQNIVPFLLYVLLLIVEQINESNSNTYDVEKEGGTDWQHSLVRASMSAVASIVQHIIAFVSTPGWATSIGSALCGSAPIIFFSFFPERVEAFALAANDNGTGFLSRYFNFNWYRRGVVSHFLLQDVSWAVAVPSVLPFLCKSATHLGFFVMKLHERTAVSRCLATKAVRANTECTVFDASVLFLIFVAYSMLVLYRGPVNWSPSVNHYELIRNLSFTVILVCFFPLTTKIAEVYLREVYDIYALGLSGYAYYNGRLLRHVYWSLKHLAYGMVPIGVLYSFLRKIGYMDMARRTHGIASQLDKICNGTFELLKWAACFPWAVVSSVALCSAAKYCAQALRLHIPWVQCYARWMWSFGVWEPASTVDQVLLEDGNQWSDVFDYGTLLSEGCTDKNVFAILFYCLVLRECILYSITWRRQRGVFIAVFADFLGSFCFSGFVMSALPLIYTSAIYYAEECKNIWDVGAAAHGFIRIVSLGTHIATVLLLFIWFRKQQSNIGLFFHIGRVMNQENEKRKRLDYFVFFSVVAFEVVDYLFVFLSKYFNPDQTSWIAYIFFSICIPLIIILCLCECAI